MLCERSTVLRRTLVAYFAFVSHRRSKVLEQIFGIFVVLAALNLPCILVTKCGSINSFSTHLHASLLLISVLKYATFTSQNT